MAKVAVYNIFVFNNNIYANRSELNMVLVIRLRFRDIIYFSNYLINILRNIIYSFTRVFP